MKTVVCRIFILSFLAFAMYACTSKSSNAGDGTVDEVDVDGKNLLVCNFENVTNEETWMLSDLVEDLNLIHFENKDEALFKAWFVSIYDNYIGVRQGQGPYKLFDKSGKYIADAGAIGQGPGEYSISLYDDVIDEKSGIVYLAPFAHSSKILAYDLTGKYIGDVEVPVKLKKPKLHLSKDGVLSFVHMAFTNDDIIAGQLDKERQLVKQIAPPENLRVQNFDGELWITRNTDAFEFHHTSVDSLFHYDLKENKIYPVFTLTHNGENTFKQYIETKDYFITLAHGKNATVATNKNAKTSSFIKLVNDFYGNMEMPISILNFRNGYYVLNLEPGQLIDMIQKRLEKSDCTQEDKKVLQELLATLDENANNVLFYGKLKR